jgi:ADP-ribose pyrophosphatase
MPDPKVEILDRTVVFEGYFQMVRYRLRHWQFAGGFGPELVREVFVRGHAAAVLPYDPVRDEVVLVEQFRAGALETPCDPWLLEPVAGIIEDGEGADEVAAPRGARGGRARDPGPRRGLLLFMSPGGSSEIVHSFIGRVDATAAGGIFGLPGEGEDIKVHVLSYAKALGWLDGGCLRVASTLLAMQWLARHHEALRARWRQAAPVQAS